MLHQHPVAVRGRSNDATPSARRLTRADITAVLVRAGNGGVVKIPLGKRMDRLTTERT
ncbi:MAG: hypothetical protein QOE52_4130 [Mycobacterium sp.]|jgi:hypothetical protein|nr:hypothetical protein [Mycobacterium sp.]